MLNLTLPPANHPTEGPLLHLFEPVSFFFFNIYLFWLGWVSIAAPAFSSCSEQGLLSLVAVGGLLL